MRVTISSKLVNARVNEASSFTLVASFFDDSVDVWSASTPTSAKFRIDRTGSNPGCWQEVAGWTTLVPATSISIPITAANNAVQCAYAFTEPRQITVRANDGLSTQTEEVYKYSIVNVAGST